MIIGIPKEIKNEEYRVGMTPAGVAELCRRGHKVVIQKAAGSGAGFTDAMYEQAGAQLLDDAEKVFEQAELLVKVKEPMPNERELLKSGQTLFTYLHLAPDVAQVDDLLQSGVTTIAYEMVKNRVGELPLLSPMSEVAGRLSVQAAAFGLEKKNGGKGLLLSGVPGVRAADVVIIGGGVVGSNALTIAVGMGAKVTVIDNNIATLRSLDSRYRGRITTLVSSANTIEKSISKADVVIGAVLIPGAKAPKLVTEMMIRNMSPGSVLVDVAIDQGGCFETSKATTHSQPIYLVDGVVHYCVANMPGAVPLTSTMALTNATFPYVCRLADLGVKNALLSDEGLLSGLSTVDGLLTCEQVAQSQDRDWVERERIVNSLV